MDIIKIEITYNDKKYIFEYGSQAYIFHSGIYNDIDTKYGIDCLLDYVALVHKCYLSDCNRTPLGELCDYVAEHWNEMKILDRLEILDKFYSEIGL